MKRQLPPPIDLRRAERWLRERARAQKVNRQANVGCAVLLIGAVVGVYGCGSWLASDYHGPDSVPAARKVGPVRARAHIAIVCSVAAAAGCGPAHGHRGAPPHPPPVVTPQPASTCSERGSGLYVVPDPHCTPGEWIADADLSRAHVCAKGYNPRPPLAVSAPLKRAALREYGLSAGASSSHEADHYFPLWLGGATTLRNFWPEPNYQHPSGYNLNPKDKLEFAVYKLTCRRRLLTPAQARQIFESGSWPRAYETYVGAETNYP